MSRKPAFSSCFPVGRHGRGVDEGEVPRRLPGRDCTDAREHLVEVFVGEPIPDEEWCSTRAPNSGSPRASFAAVMASMSFW
jgi:hypothetical protein